MADYWCWYLYNSDKKLNDLQKHLQTICPDFAVIRDVADASKHHKLTRPTKQLTSSEQITRPPGLFEAPFGEGVFAEAANVIFKLDNGTERLLEDAVRSVLSMWETILALLLPPSP